MRKLFTTIFCLVSAFASAQLKSPVVNADNTVTFCIPDSGYDDDEVYVVGSFAERKCEMKKENGVFSYTTPVLPSEMYTYRFEIDDEYRLDSSNRQSARDAETVLNYFIIPGSPGSMYMDQNVAHGKVEKVWYPSSFSSNMKQRRMFVYLPSGYSAGSARFPVLYLLHGTGGDETSWCDMGRMAQIMDNMIALGRCQPMIVVMPNCMADLDAAPGESPYMQGEASRSSVSSWMGRTEAAFPDEIVGYVEKNYRVIADKQHRAIAGLSMGGMHTMAIAANNPDMFDYVGLFSPQTISGLTDGNINKIKNVTSKLTELANMLPFKGLRNKLAAGAERVSNVDIYSNIEEKIKAEFQTPPSLYYIAIGRDDALKHFLDDYRNLLERNQCKYTYYESAGGHSWENWRKYLIEFLPQLFK